MSALAPYDPLMMPRDSSVRNYSNRRKVNFTAQIAGKHFLGRSRLSDLELGSHLPQATPLNGWPEGFLITVLRDCTTRGLKLHRFKEFDWVVGGCVASDQLSSYWKAIFQASEQPLAKWREEIRAFSSLVKGWDSYNAGPPSKLAIDIALEIIDAIEGSGVSPDYVIPTSDDSILFKHAHGDSSYLWEIESDGEIGLMIESADKSSTFHSVDQSQVLEFLDVLADNV